MKYTTDYYAMLQVSRSASDEVIRSAYKALAKKYHPDTNNGDPNTSRIMAWINEAYSVLSTPSLKREYDAVWDSIHKAESPRPTTAAKSTYSTGSQTYTATAPHRSQNGSQSTQQNSNDSFDKAHESKSARIKRVVKGRKVELIATILAVIAVVTIIIGSAFSAYQNDAPVQSTPTPKPVSISNGVVKRASGTALAPVKINAPSTESVYVYFKSSTNSSNDFSVFVKAGSSYETDAPLDTYTVYYAQGTTWYGIDYKYGSGTDYYRADSKFRFYIDGQYYRGAELTLYKVYDGNMDTQTINKGSFPD